MLCRLAGFAIAAFYVMGCVLSAPDKEREIAARAECPVVECEDSTYGVHPHAGVFHGMYYSAFEASEFEPDGVGCEYWLTGDIEALRLAVMERGDSDHELAGHARIVVEGILSGPGCYGHMGMSRRQLVVSDVISAQIRVSDGGEWMSLALPTLPTPTPIGPLPSDKLRP